MTHFEMSHISFLLTSCAYKMSRRRETSVRSIAHSRELPPCLGPKLHAFELWDASIEWLERLDGDRKNQSGTEACVFKVKIKSQEYALKVVSNTIKQSEHS